MRKRNLNRVESHCRVSSREYYALSMSIVPLFACSVQLVTEVHAPSHGSTYTSLLAARRDRCLSRGCTQRDSMLEATQVAGSPGKGGALQPAFSARKLAFAMRI